MMTNNEVGKKGLRTWLFKPFVYKAGWEALALGIVVIVLTGYIGSFTNTHFDGVLDTHTGMEAPWWCFLAEGIVAWLAMGVVMWGFGKCISKTSFRSVDIFGTQALARWPFLLTSLLCLLPGYARFTDYIIRRTAGAGEKIPFPVVDAIVFGIVLAGMLVFLCWSVYLMYRSYSVSCNIKGSKAIGSFIGGIFIAELIFKILITGVFFGVQQDHSWKPILEAAPETSAANRIYQNEMLYTFDDEAKLEKINSDKGLTVGVENGEYRIQGTSTDREWKADAVLVKIAAGGSDLDVSGKFRIEEAEGDGLVFLGVQSSEAGEIILIYSWDVMKKNYWIQRHWLRVENELVSGRPSLSGTGTEQEAFNSMRIHVRKDRQHVDFYANNVYIDTAAFDEHIGEITSAKMELQSPRKDCKFDIRFDDLRVRWDDSPIEATRREMERSTGGLLVRYSFDDEGSVTDSSGQMSDGSIRGTPTWVSGVKGKALSLDGEGSYVKMPFTRRLQAVPYSNFTVTAWFKPGSTPAQQDNGFGIVVKPGCDIGLVQDKHGIFRFSRYFHGKQLSPKKDAMRTVWLGGEKSDPGRWYHLVGVVDDDGKTSRLYVDGELIAKKEHPNFIRPLENHHPWYVGACDGPGGRWPAHGAIDEVRIYNRALSVEEIGQLYNETAP
jgi:hypothetical protein